MPPSLAGGGPRVLLRRLRESMAEQTSAQARLDKLVSVIAANMVAEVCSIYLRRAGGAIALFATEGLNRIAIETGVPVGFGLLTCDTTEQALDRAGLPESSEDKGREAAMAAVETALTLREIRRAASQSSADGH